MKLIWDWIYSKIDLIWKSTWASNLILIQLEIRDRTGRVVFRLENFQKKLISAKPADIDIDLCSHKADPDPDNHCLCIIIIPFVSLSIIFITTKAREQKGRMAPSVKASCQLLTSGGDEEETLSWSSSSPSSLSPSSSSSASRWSSWWSWLNFQETRFCISDW